MNSSSNPHPVRRLGAIRFKVPFNQHAIEVPILTQSEDWALSQGFARAVLFGVVPILTQSEDWAL